jgi:hypothetical protein
MQQCGRLETTFASFFDLLSGSLKLSQLPYLKVVVMLNCRQTKTGFFKRSREVPRSYKAPRWSSSCSFPNSQPKTFNQSGSRSHSSLWGSNQDDQRRIQRSADLIKALNPGLIALRK